MAAAHGARVLRLSFLEAAALVVLGLRRQEGAGPIGCISWGAAAERRPC